MKSFQIVLLDLNEATCRSWRRELNELNKVVPRQSLRLSGKNSSWPIEIKVHNGALGSLKFEQDGGGPRKAAIVSPGNSAGFLGGGFDLALARFFEPEHWQRFESFFQEQLFKITRGYSNGAHLVPLSGWGSNELLARERGWHCDSILHLPTMKTPGKIEPSMLNQTIFDLSWDLLTEILEKVDSGTVGNIDTVIIPGLATGYGGVPSDICAKAMCYAMYIFCTDLVSGSDRSKLCYRYLGVETETLFGGPSKPFNHTSDGPELLFCFVKKSRD